MGDSSKNRVLPKEDTKKAFATVGIAASKIKSCMPYGSSGQEIQFDVPYACISRNGDSSKNRVDPKEDIGKTSSNVGMAASKIESCMPTGSSCREIQFDVPHAYISRNG